MRTDLDNKEKSAIFKVSLMTMFTPKPWRRFFVALVGCFLLAGGRLPSAHAEAMLQLFNVSWAEMTQKMPELAEAGYDSIWIPPPTKGSGALSVGYDLWDPFDLGSKDQRNTVRTRYGTEAELLQMIETAHRFGIRIYLDNIMNHRAFDVPGYNETTPTGGEGQAELYPGMVPEDFHLRKTEDGFYRKWDNTRDWNSQWQVQNLGLADLIDIAQETPNANFGMTEGSTSPKYSFVRDLERPGQYDKDKDGNTAYFGVLLDQARAELGPSASQEDVRLKAKSYILANKAAFKEDVGGYLIRAARWEVDRTRADGLRLDAVKHVPDYFFGKQSGNDKDTSNDGYLGGVQWQFNRTRGFSDANNRDSVFEDKIPRDDALVFGEHLGAPPGYGGYWDAGMRLVDNELRGKLNGVLGNPNAGLQGLDSPGAGGFAPGLGVTHANSHDSDYSAQREWQHAFYMTREGIGLIYSDGYHKAETLGESGGAFPRHANTQYLGQFGDPRIPNILKIHNDFARGLQDGKWSDNDFVAFERRDNRKPDGSVRTNGTASEEVTMAVMLNDNTAQGQSRNFSTSFPSNAYLYQYATGPSGSSQVGFYKYANELNNVQVPPGGYFVFGWRTPELSTLWPQAAITLYQNGKEVPTLTVTRKDGPDGDKQFNPLGLGNRGYPVGTTPEDYSYQTTVPVIKGGPVTILARADGSAENIMLKLDGGVNLNSTRLGTDPGWRDNPPGLRTDVFLGYEQPDFVDRQHPEKFAAVDTTRNRFGSAGAETYTKTIGGSWTINNGPDNANNYNTEGGNVASFVYHDPVGTVGGPDGTPGVGDPQYDESGANIILWVKTNSGLNTGFKTFVYYTTDGTYPEGAGGIGRGTTQVAALSWKHDQGGGNAGSWWGSATLPKPTPGTKLIYKIGVYRTEVTRDQNGNITNTTWSKWPSGPTEVDYKKRMLTTFRVDNFDPATAQFFPHNDYARTPDVTKPYSQWSWATQTGLSEGYHVLRARAFLNRDPQTKAPLYQTFTQTFYYDAQTPTGQMLWPAADNDTVGGSGYDLVFRTDSTVEQVWFHITDSDDGNDDTATSVPNGNGTGFEPFVDANQNGVWDAGEKFTDLNGNGVYDASLSTAWGKATQNTSVNLPDGQKEWRFRYNNIPATGTAAITVRLLEASSSHDMTLDAATAHATELTRTVQTRGPDERVMIKWPQNDGDKVDDSYVMKVYFTQALANGTSTESLKQRFTFSIASTESGSDRNAVAQTRDNFTINYNVGGGYHELAIPLPNLYNDVPDFLHTLKVTYTFPDNRKLEAVRLVTAKPSDKPFIRITRPTEVDSDGRATQIILKDLPGPDAMDYEVLVETSAGVTNAPVITGINITGTPVETLNGNIKTWSYNWHITAPGNYFFTAEAAINDQAATTGRNARVVLRQVVDPSGNDNADDDNDGLLNIEETNQKPLPPGNPETWSNADVYAHFATGRTLPISPDSDGDGLPDALELGLRTPAVVTDTNADTNGDGIPNFLGDFDPPLYAVLENAGKVPGVGDASKGDNRTRQAAGSVTAPNNPDTDADGLPDGIEDANHNGWVDGDGKSLPLTATRDQYMTHRPNIGDWPNDVMDSWETWQETSPTKGDSDGDGLLDGYGEDKNFNGRTDMALLYEDGSRKDLLLSEAADGPDFVAGADFRIGPPTSRAINYPALFAAYAPNSNGDGTRQVNGWPKLLITEVDPLNPDTDGDGLPDGWEVNNGLDPLDNGIYNFRTGGPGNPDMDESGDPDHDGFTNAQELASGTNPTVAEGSGGGGSGEGSLTIGNFTDWNYNDLLVLDEYNEGGSQAADVYRTNQYDNSRDIVAFSFRDGGDAVAGGDGRLYFRVDFLDLAPNAWEGEVNAYVVIDTGNPAVGERALPDNIKIATDMRWEVVMAAYGQNTGNIYVDMNRTSNTTDQFQNPLSFGVEARPFGGRNEVEWSSKFDAVEIAIDRQHLKDAGWTGNPETLNLQVFTTKPGTQSGGPGDLAGRNNIRDTIYDDWVASDYWKDQDNIRLNGKLANYFGRSGSNDRGKSAKVMLVAHGNQAIQPGSITQKLIHDGAAKPAGYFRLLETHENYNAPLTLHITPTLASALQWAANPAPGAANDGPAFNARIASLSASGRLDLLGSTFADHIPKYFLQDFNNQNKVLAEKFLDGIYGTNSVSRSIFWAPERVLDDTSLATIKNMGYSYTLADQMRHFLKWFGRSEALGTPGYRLNEVNGMKIFPIHDVTSAYLNQTLDEGSSLPVRQLLSRRARSSVQDQVVSLWSDLGDFASDTKASNYDANVFWFASRPWIRVVTAQQIADGQVIYKDTNGNPQATWGTVNRGTGNTLVQTAKDWVDHATQENYDNWYNGSAYEEGLRNRTFGATTPFGQVGVSGHANDAWNAVSQVYRSNLQDVARAVLGGAMFQTAFHNTTNNDLSKFSTGDYINPDTGAGQTLADFARNTQGQARFAKIYARVQEWAANANASTLAATAEDIDLDGANEYLLYNNRVFAVFEKKGGRMTAAWLRDPSSGNVWQVAGNFASYSNTDTENEGDGNFTGNTTVDAYRTSGFKDWYALTGGNGSSAAVNADYTVAPAASGMGWTFSQGGISKTITLADATTGNLTAAYALSGPDKLYVRVGLAPNLLDLMLHGQAYLQTTATGDTRLDLANNAPGGTVRAFVETSAGSKISTDASDKDASGATTVNMRNQAQTQQVEVEIIGNTVITLGFDQGNNLDTDEDGLPDQWEMDNFGILDRDGAGDFDGDGLTDKQEYALGTDSKSAASTWRPSVTRDGAGFHVTFPTAAGRAYTVKYRDSLTAGQWAALTHLGDGETNPMEGTGINRTVTDTTAGSAAQRFYRVEVSLP